MINCKHGNAFELIKDVKDFSIDIIFGDGPYSLGSSLEVKDYTREILKRLEEGKFDADLIKLIQNNNKIDIAGTGTDFMAKWDSPKGHDWESFFEDSYRVLKHGGYCILYGMEEVGALFYYYATKAGFNLSESLYYMFGSSFPKNLNLNKAVDSRLGMEREVIGYTKLNPNDKKVYTPNLQTSFVSDSIGNNVVGLKNQEISKSNSILGKKYEGYVAGKKPLKSNTEVIYVFHKPCKYKSYINDLMAYENGEKDIHVSAWWIDGNRIEYSKDDHVLKYDGYSNGDYESKYTEGTSYKHGSQVQINSSGRFPSNLIFDEAMAERLDEQSGELKSGDNCFRRQVGNGYHGGFNGIGNEQRAYGDEGGASRFFHVIPYLEEEQEKFIWSSKVSKFERGAGLEEIGLSNNHPTLKSLKLNKLILDLCKSPNREDETILIPFAGTFSEVIGAVASGFKEENVIAFELQNNEEHPFIDIGQARYKFWKENDFFFKDDKKEVQKKRNKLEKKVKPTIDKPEETDYNTLI